MPFDSFTEDARLVLHLAREAADELRHAAIGTEHVLLGVVAAEGALASDALADRGVGAAAVRLAVAKLAPAGVDAISCGVFIFTPGSKAALEGALAEAKSAGHEFITSGHLLLGLFHSSQSRWHGRKGTAVAVLEELGVTLDHTRPVVLARIAALQASLDALP
jgi:ATP-dependent Clp protease ATP-binding subunit ClpA